MRNFQAGNHFKKQHAGRTSPGELRTTKAGMKTKTTHALICFLDGCKLEI